MPAASRRFRRSARMLVGMRSGESASSLYVRLPKYRSRTTSSDHLSPTMSSELATAHCERGKVFAGFMFRYHPPDGIPGLGHCCRMSSRPWLDHDPAHGRQRWVPATPVTCELQVI